ncbi:MAG: oxidoreductase [Candidatus Parcubacteria bacterium]|nr:oxidoreductase [Burkholderiales bacterium]
MKAGLIEVRVERAAALAEGILSCELRPPAGGSLPAFAAGAHVDLYLPKGMVRSYSLVNPQQERHRYVIAVNRDAASRGGSAWLHGTLREGSLLSVGAPRNNFPLAEDAAHSLFIAGGIGITPLWCMIQRLQDLGRSWNLVYCARTPRHAAFLAELERFGPAVRFNFDAEPGGAMLDLAQVVAAAAPETHLYCCGPVPMLEAFERAAAAREPSRVHVEYFSAKAPRALDGGYTVVLARSRLSFNVARGKTIIDTLIEQGFDAPYSCLEGVCGTCETRVLEGTPDHRDLVLSKDERAANRTMMICCSGSRTEKLVLDL